VRQLFTTDRVHVERKSASAPPVIIISRRGRVGLCGTYAPNARSCVCAPWRVCPTAPVTGAGFACDVIILLFRSHTTQQARSRYNKKIIIPLSRSLAMTCCVWNERAACLNHIYIRNESPLLAQDNRVLITRSVSERDKLDISTRRKWRLIVELKSLFLRSASLRTLIANKRIEFYRTFPVWRTFIMTGGAIKWPHVPEGHHYLPTLETCE